MTNLSIRVGDKWLQSLRPWGGLVMTTNEHGPLAASWTLDVPFGDAEPALRQGATVRIYAGPMRVWAGILAEPNRGSKDFTADGLHRLGENYLAVTLVSGTVAAGQYQASTVIDDAVDAAIARGLPWTRPTSISTQPLSSQSETQSQPNTITQLLDAWCSSNGKHWRVDEHGVLSVYDYPPAPVWALTPGTPVMATSNDDYVTRLFARFVSGVTGTPATPSAWGMRTVRDDDTAARWGAREDFRDYTDLGLKTASAIDTALGLELDANKLQPTFVEGVQVDRSKITNLGGVSPQLWQPVAGIQSVIHHGALTAEGAITLGGTLRWVIGATSYDADADRLTLTPTSVAASTLSQVTAAQAAATGKGFS